MATYATFNVKLSYAHTDTVTVHYATQDGTALHYDAPLMPGYAKASYRQTSGDLMFIPGETNKQVSVELFEVPSNQVYGDLWFSLQLSNAINAAIADGIGICTLRLPVDPAGNGPMISLGLLTHSYHNVIAKNGYFHYYTGTAKGQAIGIEGALAAYEQLVTGSSAEQAAAAGYLTVAQSMLDAMANYLSASIIRTAIPTNPASLTLPNWLNAARGNIGEQQTRGNDIKASVATVTAAMTNAPFPVGSQFLKIPVDLKDTNGLPVSATDIFRVWQIYPSSSYMLYPYDPSSPTAAKNSASGANTSVYLDRSDWAITSEPSGTQQAPCVWIKVPASAGATPGSEWFIVFGYNNFNIIQKTSAQDALPAWHELNIAYGTYAPDSMRSINYALALAVTNDKRADKAADWTNLLNAYRRNGVRAQAMTDMREVIRPMPQYDAIPYGAYEASGFFCSSNHPSATVPTPEQQAAGASPLWSGYNFWSRVGGSGGSVAPGTYTWTPENMYDDPPSGNMFTGAIHCSVPAGSGTVLIGRLYTDEWRNATTYHQADQFLFLALSISRKPTTTERIWVYVQTTRDYSVSTRYVCDIGQFPELIAADNPTVPCYLLIPRASFKRSEGDGAALPSGAQIVEFGVSYVMDGPYTSNLVEMRLISGESEQSVRAALQKAVKGSPMPFFPGAAPFLAMANFPKQNLFGWSGSPMHGYQLPDLWWWLSAEADAVHPGLDPVSDLPIPSPTSGQMIYPINPLTQDGIVKPTNALLMEQQLIFLQQAQAKYVADGGLEGPFAHTYVLDTPSRASLGNPTPGAWLYRGDDPQTAWVGYQARVVNSLAMVVLLSKDVQAFRTAREMAHAMAIKWLVRHNALWPNLNGVTVVDPETGQQTTVYGGPTNYPHPAEGAPVATYEEPHAAALVLRACVSLIASELLTASEAALCEAIALRCWNYLELRVRSDAADVMRYTWANSNAITTQEYFGFWHFEIIRTLAYLLEQAPSVPSGIDLPTVRSRLVNAQTWLAAHTT